jgi:lipid-A-disaccharide synthase
LTPRLFLSCGEPSGDLYAGALTRELRRSVPDLDVAGLGGPQFAAAGGRVLEDYRGLAATGLTEAVSKIPKSFAVLRRLTAAAHEGRPSAVVVIDFPEINFRLARGIKDLKVPVVYYVCPQVWAWRQGRLKTIREVADQVLVIFPFEEELYRQAGIPVRFVGHPLVDLAKSSVPRGAFLADRGLAGDAPTVAILPGSRPNEVRRILPVLVAGAQRVKASIPRVQFLVARAPGLDDHLFTGVAPPSLMTVVTGDTDTVLASADLALTASGTATVQCALHDKPMVVVYRLSPLTYHIGRPLVKVDTFSMVNLIANERVVPELIQDACTPDAVAREAISLLTDPARAFRMRAGLARVRERLGEPGASRRAADIILHAAGLAGSRM